MNRHQKRLPQQQGNVKDQHFTPENPKNHPREPSVTRKQESFGIPTIEPADGRTTDSARMSGATAASLVSSEIRSVSHSSRNSNKVNLERPINVAMNAGSVAATPSVDKVVADHASIPADEAPSANPYGGNVSNADTPSADVTTAYQPPLPSKTTEPVAVMIEMPTAAPTIGNVRGLSPPCLAPGVQYRAPMVVLDGVSIGPYHLAGASQSGTAHLVNGSPRQDAYDFVLTVTGRLIVAIADGLGSRPNSQVGARLFCEQVVIAGTLKPDGSAQDYLLAAATQAGVVAEAAYALTYDDISFVAAVAVFSTEGCELARVGDVSGFSIDANGIFKELFTADGDFINIVSACLPDAALPTPEHRKTLFSDPVVLATDGLANDIRTSASLRSWLGRQWRMPLDAYTMAESLRYRRQGSHDDRTAIVVWP